MLEFIKKMFETDFMPHGHCYFWKPEIMWTHAISDSIIAIAYATIPMSLFFIFKKRKDFKYIWMAVFFAIFILGCGATHIMDVINIWAPYYRLDGAIRALTALASIGTAILLFKITPKVLLIPSASEWKRVNEELTMSHQKLQESYKELSKAEEALRRSNEDLEEKVKVRTGELEKANKELRKINYDLDSFVYVASHDLKVPIKNLQALISESKEEIRGGNPEESIELLELADRSVFKFDETINYLSDITRIYKTINEDVEEVSFEVAVNEVENSIRHLIKESGVKITKVFSEPTITFSRTEIRSLIQNLITNSIKFRSLEKAPMINISTYKEGGFVVLDLSDNGIGFDITKKDKIFQMFQRLHTHTTGTGMGLYMVKRIVENSGGLINVESEIERGTRFKLYLKTITNVEERGLNLITLAL